MKSLSKRAALVASAALVATTMGQAVGMSPASASTNINLGMGNSQVSTTPVAYAIDKGIFARNGLSPTVQVLPSADVIPQLSAGRIDFAYVTAVLALQARTNAGIDLRIVTASDGFSLNQARRAAKDRAYAKIIDPSGVCANPTITRPRDLEGKTVGVGLRNSFPELVVGDAIRKDGGDPSKVRWAVVGATQIVPSIVNGAIDAGYTSAGFSPACEQSGMRQIASPVVDTLSPNGGPVTVWVTTAKFAQENPKTVAAFQKSMYETAVILNKPDRKAMREAVDASVRYTKAPLESARATFMPYYFTTLTRAQVQKWADLAAAAGQVSARPDVRGIIYVQPKTPVRR
jgi:ABC-type nitrate/sulfonate/bicarbonate transport system substrate-binding protein